MAIVTGISWTDSTFNPWKVAFLCVALLGCSGMAPQKAESGTYVSQDLRELFRAAATYKVTQDGYANGVQVRAVYIGPIGECASIGLIQPRLRRVATYEVCRNTIRERMSIPPALPDGRDAAAALDNVRRQALSYGVGLFQWQGFHLVATRLGPGYTQGACASIELIVSYEMDLVLQNVKEVCR